MRFTLAAVPALVMAAAPAVAQEAWTLYFAHDSSRLTAEHMSILDAAADQYRTTGTALVSIVGHTDTSGTAEYNRALSQRRAEAAQNALTQRGVPGSSITTAWRGEEDLAVPTADGVREARNRRVELALAAADIPEPAPVMAPAPVVEEPNRFRVLVAPFGAWNNQTGDESFFAGVNATASYDVTPFIVVSAEQAGFYNFDSNDDGWGGRTAAGLDFQLAGLGVGGLGGVAEFLPYVGANGGYTYIDGSGTGGWFAGPEVGLRIAGFEAKVAYDIYVEDQGGRNAGDGVLSATIGYGLRF